MLDKINGEINKRNYEQDEKSYLDKDKWLTPKEFANNNYGDCEDFAISKYFKLKEQGIDPAKLSLAHVTLADGRAHMVLHHLNDNGTTSVLDNMTSDIKLTTDRTDLTTVYSFNEEGLYLKGKRLGNGSRVSKWKDLLERIENERYNEEEIL